MTAIWSVRNNPRFNIDLTHWKSAISWISSNITLAGNNTRSCSTGSIRDFTVLKNFNVIIHPPKAPVIKEIVWQPPIANWVKCNTDGASNLVTSSCGGIFRNSDADFLCCFAENTGLGSAFSAELAGALRAIEIAANNNWNNLWLETDSTLVVLAFKSLSLVPWNLRNRWFNCSVLIRSMNLIVSHVYREGNQCADGLANLGLNLDCFTIWNEIPQVIRESFVVNKLGRPNFRFVNF
jgi:ribonuclease HI